MSRPTKTYVEVCTTTTSYLADIIKTYGKKVFIVPNKLSNEDLEIINKVTNNQRLTNNDKIRIGYFSGTKSHDEDFATITNAIYNIMEKHFDVEMFLFGPLGIDNKLIKFKNRIKQMPFVSRAKHFENITTVDINLAPLESGNPF